MRAALLWSLLFLATLTIGLFFLLGEEDWLDSDITHLMPADYQDPVVSRALSRDYLGVSGELMFMVIGPEGESRDAAHAARSALDESGLLAEPRRGSSRELLTQLAPFRFGLVSDDRLAALRVDPASAYLRAVQGRLARPSSAPGLAFAEDPPAYLGDYLSRLPNPYPGLRARDGLWIGEHGDDVLWLIPRELKGEAFDGRIHDPVTSAVASARNEARAHCPDCELLAAGPVLFAAEQRALAQGEIALLSTLSLGGIVLLMLLAFGSLRPLLPGAAALLTGVLTAAAVSLLLFGRLHVITLVAGTTLLGIAIDYVFKYLVHRSEQAGQADGSSVVRSLRRPMMLGVASSLLCLVVLAVSPFPVMRELAVFSGAGLAGAWLTVMLLFPVLDRRGPAVLRPSLSRAVNRPLSLFFGLGRARWLLPLFCLPLGVAAYFAMPDSDDLRAFQAELPERLSMDLRLRSLSGTDFPEGFFIVEGDSADSVLERERALLDTLAAADGPSTIALSHIVPPESRQQEAHALMGEALHDPNLRDELLALGLREEQLRALRSQWADASERWLQPADLAEGPLAPLVENLWLDHPDQPASLVVLRGNLPPDLTGDWPEGVRFIRPVELMNANLSAQRSAAGNWILAAAVLGIPALFILFLGPGMGLRPALAPLCALSLTLAFLWLSGIGLNTFVLMGVILGLGVGADYAAFLGAERRVSPAGVTGIALAALTTLLAFGLLGLSQVPALGQFGLTVVVAIVAAWVSAFTLALPSEPVTQGPGVSA